MAAPELVVKILTDAKGASAGIDEASSKFSGLKDTMGKLAVPAGAVLASIVAMGVGAVNSASDVQQAMGSVDAVFGKSAGQIKKWSDQAAQSVGLSKAQYAQFAAIVGAQLKNLGVPFDQVAGDTNNLIKLGADLAATYGGTTADAVDALSSALRGEADPAEKYGLALNATAVNAKLAEEGLSGLQGQALTAAKAQAIMQMATEQAGGAVGQFASEANTLEGQQQRLNATWTDAQAALGTALLPVITPVVNMLAQFAQWVQKNQAVMVPLIAAVAALAAGILVLNVVMAANPIGLLIVAIAALIAGIMVLWNTNEGFRNFFMSAWKSITDFFSRAWQIAVAVVTAYLNVWKAIFQGIIGVIVGLINFVVAIFTGNWKGAADAVSGILKTLQGTFEKVFAALKVPIDAVVGAFQTVVHWIQQVINWLGKIKVPNLGAIGSAAGAAASSAQAFTTTGARMTTGMLAAPTATASSGGGVVININGGLDSADTIARRIQQLLDARTRRTGGVVIARRAT